LEVPPLIVAGLEAAYPGETPLAMWRGRLDAAVAPAEAATPRLQAASWPPVARRVLETVDQPRPLRDLLALLAGDGKTNANDVLRAVEVLAAAGLVAVGAVSG